MKAFYSIIGALILGVILGVGSAYQAISTGWGLGVETNKIWRTYGNLAEPELSSYAKAYLVNSGHLPLPQDQALYFFTYEDSKGQKLSADCDYILTGDNVDAFWWSVSAHNHDFERFENSSQRYSFNMANVIRNADGKYDITLSKRVNGGNWLPINPMNFGDDAFMLSLRLYGIDKTTIENVDLLNLPAINKVGCDI